MYHVRVTLSNFRESNFDSKLSEKEIMTLLNKKWMRFENGNTISFISAKDIILVELENFDPEQF